jgi:choline-sulfatase
MSDQHRFDWLGCRGLEGLHTPHLDRLAEEGVLFSQATCNSPLCAPSRAALATGLRPPRCHVLDNSYSLSLDAWTIYRHLRRYGYRTSLFGKLDLHKPQFYNGVRGDLPVVHQLGFTDPLEAEGKQHGAQRVFVEGVDGSRERLLIGPYQRHLRAKGLLESFSEDYAYRQIQHAHYAQPSVLPCEDFEDAWIGEKACEYLREVNGDSPWFTFVSFVGPHNPWDAPQEYLQQYEDVPMPDPVVDPGTDRAAWVQQKQEEMMRGTGGATAQKMRQNYSGMVTLIDDYVGEMLDILSARDLLEDTIIVYTSDHGEMLGDLGLVHKSVQYESALRVPLILSGWGIPRMGATDALVELFDVTPTLLEVLDLPVPAELDARSFAPLLRGETRSHRQHQIAQLPFTTCIRDGDYKAIVNPNDHPELYDLRVDPWETENIYEEDEERYQELMQKLHEHVTGGRELNA